MQEEVEVEAFVFSTEVKTECPVGSSVTDVCAVVGSDLTITVHIHKAEVAWNSVWLDEVAFTVDISVDFGSVLEHTCCLVAIEEWERLTILGACTTVGELVDTIIEEAGVVTEVFKFVVEVGCITLDRVVEIAHMTAVAEFKFKAGVLHITHVTKRFRFTYITWDRHFDNHAVGFLDEVVGSECEGAVEETKVKTDVGLFALLPFEVGVGEAVGFRADGHI